MISLAQHPSAHKIDPTLFERQFFGALSLEPASGALFSLRTVVDAAIEHHIQTSARKDIQFRVRGADRLLDGDEIVALKVTLLYLRNATAMAPSDAIIEFDLDALPAFDGPVN